MCKERQYGAANSLQPNWDWIILNAFKQLLPLVNPSPNGEKPVDENAEKDAVR